MNARTSSIGIITAGITLFAALVSGCGKSGDGDTRQVAVTSVAQAGDAAAMAAVTTPEPLFVCVKKITLEDEINNSREVDLPIGLVDASQPKVDWGTIALLDGFRITRIKIKVQKSREVCKTDYSIKYGTATSPQDIEFRWYFTPPIEVSESLKTIKLSFNEVLANLAEAVRNGTLSSIKERVEEVQGTCGVN